MFGRKPTTDSAAPSDQAERPVPASFSPSRPPETASAPPRSGATPIPASPSPSVPRPAPAAPKRADIPAQPARQASEQRKLIVGQGIAFSGEIGACDHLIVEGAIEAKLPEGNRIDIAVTGVFRGTASAEEVDIAGCFEGELTVKGRLTLRSTGRVDGKVQYGELAVEAGGTIDGEIRSLAKPAGN